MTKRESDAGCVFAVAMLVTSERSMAQAIAAKLSGDSKEVAAAILYPNRRHSPKAQRMANIVLNEISSYKQEKFGVPPMTRFV